jgi:hypothetical protein
MDAFCFSIGHAERDGAADSGSIAVAERCASKRGAIECCRGATLDHASADGSTGCIAARQPGYGPIRSRAFSFRDSAHDHGSSGGSRH